MGFLSVIKAVGGFISVYKIWIYAGLLGTALITTFNYIDNHGEMKATVEMQEQALEVANLEIASLITTIKARDATITRMNLANVHQAEQEQKRLETAKTIIQTLRTQRDILTEELSVSRFELLEAIENDEEFADWVDGDVPISGWRLLREAADSGPRDDLP